MRHIVVSYYIKDNVCRRFVRHIVVNYYIRVLFVAHLCVIL